MRPHVISLLLGAAVALAGCALTPPPEASDIRQRSLPNLQVPAQWATPEATPGRVVDNWLASFNDPQLDALVREALAYNADLAVAGIVEQAAGYATPGRRGDLPDGQLAGARRRC